MITRQIEWVRPKYPPNSSKWLGCVGNMNNVLFEISRTSLLKEQIARGATKDIDLKYWIRTNEQETTHPYLKPQLNEEYFNTTEEAKNRAQELLDLFIYYLLPPEDNRL